MSSCPNCRSINPLGSPKIGITPALAVPSWRWGAVGAGCAGGERCNPRPPSPSESWEQFWFLCSGTNSCREQKWQLAFGACLVGKGNRYARVRVHPRRGARPSAALRGAGPPAQRVPASCSWSPGWANCFHGRVWVTWGSAQGAARSGDGHPRCPRTSGCGWRGAGIWHRGAHGGCEPCREVPVLANLSRADPTRAVRWVLLNLLKSLWTGASRTTQSATARAAFHHRSLPCRAPAARFAEPALLPVDTKMWWCQLPEQRHIQKHCPCLDGAPQRGFSLN